jgi:uncharacterized protein (TIGR03032 family)
MCVSLVTTPFPHLLNFDTPPHASTCIAHMATPSGANITQDDLLDAIERAGAKIVDRPVRADKGQPQQQPQQQPHQRGSDENANPSQPQFEIHASPTAAEFFTKNNVSLVATAYKSNLVFSFGATDDGRLGVFYSVHQHPMGAAASKNGDDTELWIGCNNLLVRYAAVDSAYNLGSEEAGGGGDFTSSFVARQAYFIGSQDVHGIYPLNPHAPYFVSTKCSVLCQLDVTKPTVTTNALWKPPFISEVRAEDRCHLNEVCFINGMAVFATSISESDAQDGWRDHRSAGGVIINVMKGTIVARGLSMPHSPRWFRDQLWVLNSGTGELGTINFKEARFEPKVFIPGFLRGLQFVGRYAVVGSSLDRKEGRFRDLTLGKTLDAKKTTAVCGLYFVDLATFTLSDKIEIKGNIHELYDLVVLPGRRARVLGLNDPEANKMLSVRENFVQPAPLEPDGSTATAAQSPTTKSDDDENEEEK